MIYSCPNCAAKLEYNPNLGCMECLSCGSFFKNEEIMQEQEFRDDVTVMNAELGRELTGKQGEEFDIDGDGIMECNIYSCTACGAELSVNGVEASTFCAYCGRPTVVFNRVSNQVKPKYIIPFMFSKEQAVASIREHLSKGFFVPKEIKNFEVERVRGIYIPYWLYDIYYYDNQRLKGTVKSGKSSKTVFFRREAQVNYHNFPQDASKQLFDGSSQRLEPYDMRRLRPFDVSYMAGFYSDRYDVSKEEAQRVVMKRAKELFDAEVIKTVRASGVKIIESRPIKEVRNVDYVMLPAWFMTFRYNNEPYTMLVNGQTGKLVGAVPFNKKKVVAIMITLFIILALILTPLGLALGSGCAASSTEEFEDLLIGGGIAVVVLFVIFGAGIGNFKSVMESIRMTKGKAMDKFVKDRQGDD